MDRTAKICQARVTDMKRKETCFSVVVVLFLCILISVFFNWLWCANLINEYILLQFINYFSCFVGYPNYTEQFYIPEADPAIKLWANAINEVNRAFSPLSVNRGFSPCTAGLRSGDGE